MNVIVEHKFPYLSLLFGTNGIAALVIGIDMLLMSEGVVDVLISLLFIVFSIICAAALVSLRKRRIWAYKLLITVFLLNYALIAGFMYAQSSDATNDSFNLVFILIGTVIYLVLSSLVTYHVYDEINNDLTKNI